MWFKEPPQSRIVAWRDWRNGLAEKPIGEAIDAVAQVWAQVPTVMHYLAPDQPEQWPNPWQLITDNIYCDLSICLGMTYTLALIEHPDIVDVDIEIYRDPDGWVNLSSVNQGKYVLNYSHGRVVNRQYVLKDNMKIAFSYSKIDLCNKFQ